MAKGWPQNGLRLWRGVSRTEYASLSLYRVTHDEKCLARPSRFAGFMLTPRFLSADVPHSSWPLYDGWAGALCFLVDVSDPENAEFPLFEF